MAETDPSGDVRGAGANDPLTREGADDGGTRTMGRRAGDASDSSREKLGGIGGEGGIGSHAGADSDEGRNDDSASSGGAPYSQAGWPTK